MRFFGFITIALIFVRFCRPTAAVAFSSPLVYRPYDGRPTLMFRVANVRQHSMAEAEFRFTLIRERTNKEGERYVRFYPLHLEFEDVRVRIDPAMDAPRTGEACLASICCFCAAKSTPWKVSCCAWRTGSYSTWISGSWA